jgi:hypothetical protein
MTGIVFLTPQAARVIRGRDEADTEVKEALSHCPQCGSGHFSEYRAAQ